MRITSVDMFLGNTDEVQEPLTFSLKGAEPGAQYQVRQIVGIDAEEIIQKFYGRGGDNSPYYDFSLKPRDIVMRIVLHPRTVLGESYSDVRDDLYRAISSNRTGGIRLHFKAGATVVSGIYGYFSKFEVAYFNKLPEVQLTIRCDYPMFRAINPVLFDNVELSENPFVIPDTLSTAPHGFRFQCHFNTPTYGFTMQDREIEPNWVFWVSPPGGFFVDDVLRFSSDATEKFIVVERGGDTLGLANAIVPMSMWPLVFPFPSQNTFFIVEDAAIDSKEASYYAAYWGV